MNAKLFKFYINELSEYQDLFNMVIKTDVDTSSSRNRATQYSIPASVANDKTGKLLKKFLHNQYVLYKNELKCALRFSKKFSTQNDNNVRQRLESVFEHSIPQYTVRLNVQMAGTSDWFGTDISIFAFSYLFKLNNEHNFLLSLVWETALSQTFIDIRKKYSERQISNKKVWAIAELTAVAIWKNEFSEYDWNGVNVGYSELLPHQDKITKLYKSRKNFDEFLDSAVKLFKNIKL